MTSKEFTYLNHFKYFTPKSGMTGSSLLLKGFERDDGKLIVMKKNGEVERGDCYSKKDVKIKNFYRGKIKRVIINSSNADVPDADKKLDAKRVERIQPFIGCYTLVRKAHIANGKTVYYSDRLGEYFTENEIKITSE